MSLLIKGMKMPKNCKECPLITWECEDNFCGVDGEYLSYDWDKKLNERRHPDCPLVEIPPHGRLIDVDVLEQDAQKRLLICNKYNDQFQKPYEVMRAIALAPTVIEEEDGE